MNDKEVISLLKERQVNKAMTGLYKAWPAVKKQVMTNSGSKQDAEDIFQEALLVLIEKADSDDFVLRSSLANYINGVAKNLWYARLRKNGKEIPTGQTEILGEEINHDEEEQFTTSEKAFGLLGEKCKALLLMFYYHKWSLKTIASKLDFSNEKVAKNQKYRCLEKAKYNYVELLNAQSI
jgi:RNA polymerase sigma factor (sigma-70 family)